MRTSRSHPVDAVISSLPYYCNVAVAEAARRAGIHYFDLTEDVEVTRAVRKIADGAAQAFVPQCGLAPGFISIAANELIGHFDELRTVKLRVGALPQHPNNVLKYSLTWSTEGLINEYGNPCEAIVDGRRIEAAPLEGLEEIEIDGTLYEAFNTSGGLGSLAETYGARSQSMDYKTMRYPGHCEQMRLLMNDLKLNHDRGTLKRILENAVPQTLQDVVVDLRRRDRQAGWRAARRELRQQGVSADDRRTPVVRDPGDDRVGHQRRRGPGAEQRRSPRRLRAPGRFPPAGRAAEPLRQALRGRAAARRFRRTWSSAARPATSAPLNASNRST